MTQYNPQLRKPEPGNPDTVLGYDNAGLPEFTPKASISSLLDIDSFPVGVADDTADRMLISDQSDSGNEKYITLADLQSLIGGVAGSQEVILDIDGTTLNGAGSFDILWTAGRYSKVTLSMSGINDDSPSSIVRLKLFDNGVLVNPGFQGQYRQTAYNGDGSLNAQRSADVNDGWDIQGVTGGSGGTGTTIYESLEVTFPNLIGSLNPNDGPSAVIGHGVFSQDAGLMPGVTTMVWRSLDAPASPVDIQPNGFRFTATSGFFNNWPNSRIVITGIVA